MPTLILSVTVGEILVVITLAFVFFKVRMLVLLNAQVALSSQQTYQTLELLNQHFFDLKDDLSHYHGSLDDRVRSMEEDLSALSKHLVQSPSYD